MSETREALAGLIEAATAEFNEKGAGGFALARLSDARKALAALSDERGEERERCAKIAEERAEALLNFRDGLTTASDHNNKIRSGCERSARELRSVAASIRVGGDNGH